VTVVPAGPCSLRSGGECVRVDGLEVHPWFASAASWHLRRRSAATRRLFECARDAAGSDHRSP
jgi:hypothetical protein